MRCCKVIVPCFTEREERLKIVFPHHKQLYTTPGGVLEMLKLNVINEVPCGVPCDTIIVNQDVGYTRGNEYVRSLHGITSLNGRYYTYTRPNIGGSFGGFNFAFEVSDYDYYFFMEDDMIPVFPEYYRLALERFNSVENCGFLAMVATIPHKYGFHVAGGTGISSKKVLSELYSKFGMLPNSNKPWNHQEIIIRGEVPFTNEIYKMGYNLIDYDKRPTSWAEVKFIKPHSI
jgi:hypothetical protein